jgi:hypothetical protein
MFFMQAGSSSYTNCENWEMKDSGGVMLIQLVPERNCNMWHGISKAAFSHMSRAADFNILFSGRQKSCCLAIDTSHFILIHIATSIA